ncbi:MAG TPA: APC family permease, partial [Candidatus Bathyarchaeia archaeon]|nr:APC family permease [Candidatus Bathyarchaeia archaeon]
LGVLVVTNSSLIPGQFDHAMQFLGSSFTYSGVIQQASASGYTGSFSLTNTLWAAIPWGFFYYSGFNYGTYLAGETKNAGQTITRALLLSTAVALIVGVAMAQLAYAAFGAQFLNTASYIQSVSPLPVEPYVTFLESMSNPNLAMFFGIGLIVSWMFLCANWIMATARMLFASAFDRLLPEKFADVSDRFHSPTWATIVTGLACIAYVALFVYGGVGATWLNTSLVVPVGYLMPLIATAAFAFIKPDLFKRTVGTVTKRSSIVIASIIGIICFAFYIMAETVPINSGVFLGTSMIYAFGTIIAMAIFAAILYELAKLRLNRIGIDIRKISEELPPE